MARTIFIAACIILLRHIVAHDTAEHHRIVFVKTHKTGSSTLANIMYRFGEKRKLKFMLPTDDLRLGWPAAFPGDYVHKVNETNDKFDIVAHHSVFNHAKMLQFVPAAKFVTILRKPVSQFTSAWYFFPQKDLNSMMQPTKSKFEIKREVGRSKQALTAEALNILLPINSLNECDDETLTKAMSSHARYQLYNSQSFTLGWETYKRRIMIKTLRNSTMRDLVLADNDTKLIGQWLSYLDKVMDTILVVERLDESLVLMGHELNWGSTDLERAKLIAYLPVNVHKKPYDSPSEEVVSRLEELLTVDRSLYSFASSRLDAQLAKLKESGVDVEQNLKQLKEVCSYLHDKCTPPSSSSSSPSDSAASSSLELNAVMTPLRRKLVDSSTYRAHALHHRRSRSPSAFSPVNRGDVHRTPSQTHQKEEETHIQHNERRSYEIRKRFGVVSTIQNEHKDEGSGFISSSNAVSVSPSVELADEKLVRGHRQRRGGERESTSLNSEGRRNEVSEGELQRRANYVSHFHQLSSEDQSMCWRHASDQRSYAQQLKALYGVPCSKKMYKSPVKYVDLPVEIMDIGDKCSMGPILRRKASFPTRSSLS